jgi:hypothetical protein
MSSIRIGQYIFLDVLFHVLKMSSHPVLEELLGITNIELVSQVTFHFVDHHWFPAHFLIPVVTLTFRSFAKQVLLVRLVCTVVRHGA